MPLFSLIIFFSLLIFLFLLAKSVINLTFGFFYQLTKNKNASLELLSFFLLPGTIVHELSHMLTAGFLFVQTGELCFKPEIDENNNVRVGAVKIAKTDPFRRTFVGIAPLVVGLTIIGLVFNYYLFNQLKHCFIVSLFHCSIFQFLLLFSVFYLLSSISLTMFSSRKDLEQLLIPAVILLIIVLVFWLAGFRLTIPQYAINFADKILIQLNKSLAVVVFLNILLIWLFKGLNFIVKAIFPH